MTEASEMFWEADHLEIRPLAYGCVLCRTVLLPVSRIEQDTSCPSCGDRMGGTLEPLVPLKMMVDLMRETAAKES